MCSQKIAQLFRRSSPPEPRTTSAAGSSRQFPGGGLPIPPPRQSVEEEVRARVAERPAFPVEAPSLTERDLELLRLLADGRSTGQIAAAMSVTGNTTRTRIRRVQRKLVVAGRDQVVPAARQAGAL